MDPKEERPLVLVVDDEPAIGELYARGLPPLGFRVEVASSADEALTFLATREPDIVVTDMAMPGGSGLKVIEAVRKRGGRYLPVVALTGVAVEAEVWELGGEGAWDRYLLKPMEPRELAAILDELILDARTRPED